MRRYLEGCTLTAIGRGSRVLALKIKASTGYRPTWKHAGGAAAGAYFLWPAVGPVVPTALTVSLTLWLLAALVVGASGATPQTTDGSPADQAGDDDQDHDDEDQDEEEELQEAPPDATLWALIRHVAALSDQGTAAHLDDVLTEGHKRGWFGGWEKADLKDHLSAVGAPLTESKKLTFGGRQRVRMAVLLEGLPAAEPAPVPTTAPGTAGGHA